MAKTATKKSENVNPLDAFDDFVRGGGAKRRVILKDLPAIKRFLGRIANEVYHGDLESDRGRVLGYLLSILRDTITTTDLEARLTKLEQEAMKHDND